MPRFRYTFPGNICRSAAAAIAISLPSLVWGGDARDDRSSVLLTAQNEAGMASSRNLDTDLHKAFTNALRNIDQIRKNNRSTQVDCTGAFSDFNRYNQTTPHIAFFNSMEISVITVDLNQRHYVYWEISYEKLRSMGYREFLRGDRLVIGFTTASESSTEITSFKATLLNSNHL
jgi:hypothetical protein